MAFVNQPVEEQEKSSRDYASPRCEDIKVQESDSKLEATEYEIKSKAYSSSPRWCPSSFSAPRRRITTSVLRGSRSGGYL
jgi:hypothetical protein